MKNIKGLTLIEVLITILVISILAGVAGPSFMDSFDRRKAASAAEDLYSYIQLARSESLTRSVETNITFDVSGTTSWAFGISEGTSCNLASTTNSDAACVLNIDDGDGDDTDRSDDNVVFKVSSTDHKDITMTLDKPDSIVFDPVRGTTTETRNIKFTSVGKDITVQIGLLGNVRICSDDIGEYNAC